MLVKDVLRRCYPSDETDSRKTSESASSVVTEHHSSSELQHSQTAVWLQAPSHVLGTRAAWNFNHSPYGDDESSPHLAWDQPEECRKTKTSRDGGQEQGKGGRGWRAWVLRNGGKRERKWETELNRKGVEEGEVDKEITEQGAGQRDIKGFELREKQKEACPIESQSFVNKWDDGRCAGLTWCVGPSYLTMEFTWGVFY